MFDAECCKNTIYIKALAPIYQSSQQPLTVCNPLLGSRPEEARRAMHDVRDGVISKRTPGANDDEKKMAAKCLQYQLQYFEVLAASDDEGAMESMMVSDMYII